MEKDVEKLKLLILQLREELGRKQATILEQQTTILTQQTKILALEERLKLALQEKYVAKNEKLPAAAFNEAEVSLPLDLVPLADADEAITVASFKRKKPGRKPLPLDLPRVVKEYDLTDAEKICACGYLKHRIGTETCEQLEFIPARIQVIQNVRHKYACRSCEAGVLTAAMPAQIIPKSIATPSLLAQIIVSKYTDHLPLYRQEKILQRFDIEILRGTLSSWVIKCAIALKPLYKCLHYEFLNYDVGFGDETPVQVLNEAGRAATSKSFVWVFIGGNPNRLSILYHYTQTRSSAEAAIWLEDFSGFLHSDAFGGYQKLGKAGLIQNVFCWAHARRNFAKIAKLTKDTHSVSHQTLKHIAKLYRLEEDFKAQALQPEAIKQARQKHAKSLLEKLLAFLNAIKTPPESQLGKAIRYVQEHWQGLNRYLDDGRLEIDNNRSERAIKQFVMGRKNWLFCATPEGAQASVILYSILETAKAHGHEPLSYLTDVLTKIPSCQTLADYEALLPFKI